MVIFVTLCSIAFSDIQPTALSITELFLHEAIGGIIYGLVLGLLFHYLISATNDHSMELLLTIGIPSSGYVFAAIIGVSGPLAMVVSGIMIGNWTRINGFSKESIKLLDHFWELIDEFLNGLLFSADWVKHVGIQLPSGRLDFNGDCCPTNVNCTLTEY